MNEKINIFPTDPDDALEHVDRGVNIMNDLMLMDGDNLQLNDGCYWKRSLPASQ